MPTSPRVDAGRKHRLRLSGIKPNRRWGSDVASLEFDCVPPSFRSQICQHTDAISRLAAPHTFASWVARELGHSLAFGGASPKFFSGFHMVIHCLMKDFAARPPRVRPGMPPGYSPEPVPSARP